MKRQRHKHFSNLQKKLLAFLDIDVTEEKYFTIFGVYFMI